MKKTGITLSIVALTLVGFGLFNVAQNVRNYEGELKSLNREIAQEQETIHTLKAEWFYLNQPERLEKIARKHTSLEPIDEKNLLALSVVPFLSQPEENIDDNGSTETKQLVNKATGYESYVSKVNKKTHVSVDNQPDLPVHNISLRDIWGQ